MSALAILAAIVAAAPAPASPNACGPALLIQTQSTAPAPLRKLGDLPDGYLMRAVLLKIGACSVKMVTEPAGLGPGIWRYEPDGPAGTKPTPTAGPSDR